MLERPIGVIAFAASVIFGLAFLPKTTSFLLLLAVCVLCSVSHFVLCQIFNFAKSVIQVHLNSRFRKDKDLAGVNSTSQNDECVNKLKCLDLMTFLKDLDSKTVMLRRWGIKRRKFGVKRVDIFSVGPSS